MRLFAIAAAAFLAIATNARADEYMFSLSWEPSFCASHKDKTKCRALKPGAYDANHLVLHGLWPQSGQYCGVAQDIVTLDQNNSGWSKMPPVPVSDSTRARMNTLFPGVVSYLDRHEWYKHGTCSGLTPDGYFNLAMDLVEQGNALAVGKAITANVGKSVAVDDLCGALTQDFGSAFQKAAAIVQQGGALSEVRFALRDTGTPLALDTDHLSAARKPMSCSGKVKITGVSSR